MSSLCFGFKWTFTKIISFNEVMSGYFCCCVFRQCEIRKYMNVVCGYKLAYLVMLCKQTVTYVYRLGSSVSQKAAQPHRRSQK